MIVSMLLLSLSLNVYLVIRLRSKHYLLVGRTYERNIWLKRAMKWGHDLPNWKILEKYNKT